MNSNATAAEMQKSYKQTERY